MRNLLLISLVGLACAGPASRVEPTQQTPPVAEKDIPVFMKGGPPSQWHALGDVQAQIAKEPGLTEEGATRQLLQRLRNQAAAAHADAVVEARIDEERIGTQRIPLGSWTEYKPREAWVARGKLVQYERGEGK